MIGEIASAAGIASWDGLAHGRYRLSIAAGDHVLVQAPDVVDLSDNLSVDVVVQPVVVAILQSDENATFSLADESGGRAHARLPPASIAVVAFELARKFPGTKALVVPLSSGERRPMHRNVRVALGGGESTALALFDLPSVSKPQLLPAPATSPQSGILSVELLNSRGMAVNDVWFSSKSPKGLPLTLRSGETYWLEPGRYEIKCQDRAVFSDLTPQAVDVRSGVTSVASFATLHDVKKIDMQCRPPKDVKITYVVVTFEQGDRKWVVRTMRPDSLKVWVPAGPLRVTAETPTIARGVLEAVVSDSTASPMVIDMDPIE